MTRKFWKGAVLVSAALLAVSGTARAEDKCSNATLKGVYGFSLRGEFIGFFDARGNPHRIPNPDIIDAVFIQKFDGTGAFTRSDYVSSDGFKRPGLTDPTTGFDTGETGTYTVFPNCTGIMHITFPAPIASTIIDIRFVLTEGATTSRCCKPSRNCRPFHCGGRNNNVRTNAGVQHEGSGKRGWREVRRGRRRSLKRRWRLLGRSAR